MSASRRYRRQLRAKPALFVLPSIPDGAPASIKNGLAVRNEASRTGRCPGCHAEIELSGPIRPGVVTHAAIRHDDGCPALLGASE